MFEFQEKSNEGLFTPPKKAKGEFKYENIPSQIISTGLTTTRSAHTCDFHSDKKVEIICLSENLYLCSQCSRDEGHLNHNMINYDERDKFLKEKSQKLQESIRNMEDFLDRENKLVEKSLSSLMDNLINVLYKRVYEAVHFKGIDVPRWEHKAFMLSEKLDDFDKDDPDFDFFKTAEEVEEHLSTVDSLNSIKEEDTEAKLNDISEKLQSSLNDMITNVMDDISEGNRMQEEKNKQILHIKYSLNFQNFLENHKLNSLLFSFSKIFPGFNDLCLLLESQDVLTNLHLDFSACQELDSERFQLVSNSLKNLKNLKYFNVALNKSKNLEDSAFDTFTSCLNGLTQLRNFTFNPPFGISSNSLSHFVQVLSNLKYLRSININFSTSRSIDNSGLYALASSLVRMKNLEEIILNFSKCNFISSVAIENLFHVFRDIDKLNVLDLDFNQTLEMNSSNLQVLASSVESHNQMKILNLNLGKTNAVSDDAVNYLSNTLRNFSRLYEFGINFFDSSYLSDKNVEMILSGLQGKQNLKSLTLDFENCRYLTSKSLTSVYNLLTSITSLSCFTLNFSKLELTDYDGFLSLLEHLGNMVLLKRLSLKFKKSMLFDDKLLESLSVSLQNLNSLEQLYLNLSDTHITETGLNVLSFSLKRLNHLKSIVLKLGSCNKLTDKSLEFLSQTLQYMSYLKEVKLDFSNCDLTHTEFLKTIDLTIIWFEIQFFC